MQTVVERPILQDLPATERAAHFRRVYQAQSRFQKLFGGDTHSFSCAAFANELRGEVIRILKSKGVDQFDSPLETVHERLPKEFIDYSHAGGVNELTYRLYETDQAFQECYFSFLKDQITSLVDFPFYFQATPTIRVHCPNAAGSSHYPRYHTDVGYGHPPEEFNLWLPLTQPIAPQFHGFRSMNVADSCDILEQFGYDFDAFNDRAINEKSYNLELNRLSPQIQTPFGECIAFDSRAIHTVEPMESHTRVSMDIRILPVEDFENSPVEYQGTGRLRMPFIPGRGYFHLSSDAI